MRLNRCTHVKGCQRFTHVTSSKQRMPRQTRNSRLKLEEATQTTPSLLRRATRERATSPIKMAANEHNVRFNLDNADSVKDNVRHDDGLQDGGNGQQQMLQFAIPEGVDQATANLLTMQMTMMQNMMAQMDCNYQANQFQLEKRLDNKRRE